MTLSFCDPTGNFFVGGDNFLSLKQELASRLLDEEPVNRGRWQSLDISTSSAHDTYELLNTSLWLDIPETEDEASSMVEPDLPWAEGHFRERVAGQPVNPGDWHHRWPYHAGKEELHQDQGKYDHNYMERFWAKGLNREITTKDRVVQHMMPYYGYRFDTGDLGSVVELLKRDPLTRQAFLPVWFPEDTGSQQGQRVPCTLGYQFIVKDGRFHVTYFLRSCEIYRHFTNDVYMAMRLGQWVKDMVWSRRANPELALNAPRMGTLTMHITNLHGFVGDTPQIERMANG